MTMVARMEPPLVGSEPTIVCAVTRGPLGTGTIGPEERIPMMIGGMAVIPLLIIPLERDQDVH